MLALWRDLPRPTCSARGCRSSSAQSDVQRTSVSWCRRFVPNAEAAPAVVNAVFFPVLFLSGTFFPVHGLPDFLQWLADALPLTHLLDRDAQPCSSTAASAGDDLGGLLVVVLWGVGGAVVALRTFRWEPRGG